MNIFARSALAGLVAVSTTAAGYAASAAMDDPLAGALGPEPVTVVIDIEHSTFQPARLRVQAGTEVRFVVANHDPIGHEFIVGPEAVHERHRNGREGRHGAVPGEVSVGPLERGVTTYGFADTGTIEMACHLPGHYSYGMRGEVDVVAATPHR